MKSTILLFTIIVSICVVSCNKTDKKAQLENLKQQQRALAEEIKKLEKELNSDPTASSNEKIKTVQITTVSPTTFKHFIETQGLVETDNNIMVNPKMGGLVTNIYVQVGDQVKQGDILAQTESSVIEKGIEEVKTGLELATTVYQKQKNLWDQKIGSEVQYLTAKNNKEGLENKLRSLQAQLAMTQITSPIDGVVDDILIRVGEVAAPGFGAIRVVNFNGIKVTANLADAYIGSIKKGDDVRIALPDFEDTIQARVSFVSQVVNPSNRNFSIETKLTKNDNRIKPNMLVVVNINDQTKHNVIVIDENIIQKTEFGKTVFIISNENGKKIVKSKNVKTGLRYQGKVEITEGLKEGDQLITFGYNDLEEGQEVRY